MTTGGPARIVLLRSVPTLADSYARALGTAARAGAGAMVLARRPGSDPPTVPDVAYLARGSVADPRRLAAYQHLIGEPATDRVPPGFVHVVAFPVAMALMARDDFPLSLLGLVHVANRVEQSRTLRLGDLMDIRAYARGLAPHPRGTQVELVVEVSAPGGGRGDVWWRGVSTYLARTVRPGRARTGDAPVAPAREPFTPPEPTGRWDLAADVGRRYAAVSGDINPIHLAAIGGRALGFRRAIAHGMYTATRGLSMVGSARGDAFDWDATFEAPVLLPGRVAVRVARDGDGWYYVTWDAAARRRHLVGRVRPR